MAKKVTKAQAEEALNEEAKKVSLAQVEDTLAKEDKFHKLFKSVKQLGKYADDVGLVFALIKDYVSGHYRNCSWGVIAALVGALTYVLNPLDLIPDFVPLLGWTDDVLVIATVLKVTSNDRMAYKKFKSDEQKSLK